MWRGDGATRFGGEMNRVRIPPSIGAQAIYYAVRAASWLLGKIPVQISYALAGALGQAYCIVNPGHSRWAAYNYARVLRVDAGSREARRMARRSFANYARVLVDFFRLPHLSTEEVFAATIVIGGENLDRARAGGRGVLVVTAHFGSWDRAGVALASLGFRPTVLVDSFQPPALDAWVTRTRTRFGMKAVAVEKPGALREMYRTLARGDSLVIVIDRPEPETGVPVTFYGERTGWPAGAAQVALRTGCGIVVAGAFRQPGNRQYLGFAELVEPPAPTGDRDADAQALTQLLATRLEAHITAHPEQWYMFRPMWPVRDEGTSPPFFTRGEGENLSGRRA